MAARDRDVVDSQVRLVAPAELERRLLSRWLDDMYNPLVVLLLRQALEYHEVALGLVIVHQVVVPAL